MQTSCTAFGGDGGCSIASSAASLAIAIEPLPKLLPVCSMSVATWKCLSNVHMLDVMYALYRGHELADMSLQITWEPSIVASSSSCDWLSLAGDVACNLLSFCCRGIHDEDRLILRLNGWLGS